MGRPENHVQSGGVNEILIIEMAEVSRITYKKGV